MGASCNITSSQQVLLQGYIDAFIGSIWNAQVLWCGLRILQRCGSGVGKLAKDFPRFRLLAVEFLYRPVSTSYQARNPNELPPELLLDLELGVAGFKLNIRFLTLRRGSNAMQA